MPKRTASCGRPRKCQHDPCQHAVAGADRASRFDRDRGEAPGPVRRCQQGAFIAEETTTTSLRTCAIVSRAARLVALGADLPPDQILQLAQARLQHIDGASLFERRAGGIENQPLAQRLGESRYPRIKIIGHPKRQTAAGDDVARTGRPQHQLVETTLLVSLGDFGSGRIKRNVCRSRAPRPQDFRRWNPAMAMAS